MNKIAGGEDERDSSEVPAKGELRHSKHRIKIKNMTYLSGGPVLVFGITQFNDVLDCCLGYQKKKYWLHICRYVFSTLESKTDRDQMCHIQLLPLCFEWQYLLATANSNNNHYCALQLVKLKSKSAWIKCERACAMVTTTEYWFQCFLCMAYFLYYW